MLRKDLASAGIGVAALLGVAASMAPTLAAAAETGSGPFSALVGRQTPRGAERSGAGLVERFVLASDDRAFLVESFASEARLMFLCGPDDPRLDCVIDPAGPAPEIIKVHATRGPRGDVIYKNAAGTEMLRIASYGGATVYWLGEGEGLAASKSFGEAIPLRLAFADFKAARRRALLASQLVSAAVGAAVVFDIGAAPAVEGANAAVLADAIARTAKGVIEVADDPTGARVLAGRLRRVVFTPAEQVGAGLENGVLTIRYAPRRDIDGRPSSDAVARFLEATL